MAVRKSVEQKKAEARARTKVWIAASKERKRANDKRYRSADKGRYAAYSANYRAAQTQATPVWLTPVHKAEIMKVYRLARQLTHSTGVDQEVDHIVPLQGGTVSGLHVPWNLRVVPRVDNNRRPRLWDVDLPDTGAHTDPDVIDNTATFLERARLVHGVRYQYQKTIYTGALDKLIITCPVHGDFKQFPWNHLKGHGCDQCAATARGKKRRMTQEEFIDRASLLHQGRFNYDKVVYETALSKVVISCPLHGDFEQAPAKHLSGQQCPQCRGARISATKQQQ